MSRTIWAKSPVASGWKTRPATPRGRTSKLVSSVTYAVEIANSRSCLAGPATLRRPRSASRNPMRGRSLEGGLGGGPDRPLQLLLEPLQAGDARRDRRVGREDVGDRLLRLGRDDEERVQALGGAQVLRRDALHRPRDLQQRRGQRARAAGEDRRAAVGGELAVARERLHEDERDD